MKKKMLMWALALSMFVGMAPVKAIADDGLCNHHTEHTPECGYEEGNEHTHEESCYELAEKCVHEHSEECYIKKEDSEEKILDCKHECSEKSTCINKTLICAEETKEAKECTFECKICATQKRIDALNLEEIKAMSNKEKEEIKAEINAIYAAMDAMSEEEKMSLKLDSLKVVEEYFLSGEGITETPVEPQVQKDEPVLLADSSYETIDKEELLNNHTVKTVSPEHVKINMFDYWLHERNSTDNGEVIVPKGSEFDENGDGILDGTEQEEEQPREAGKWGAKAFYHGINVGHALIFHSNGDFGGPGGDVLTFNRWTQKNGAAYKNIVSPRLNEDGFPVLSYPSDENGEPNIEIKNAFAKVYPEIVKEYPNGTESLSYLFDPNTENEYRASFEDVKGLFQIDDQGHYYYNSKENFAELLENENRFVIYEAPAVKKDDIEGQFFPFNRGEDVFVKKDDGTLNGFENRKLNNEKYKTQANAMNHYFGMTIEATFYQPANGVISNSQKPEPMIFEFAGDDDVWIFIDGVLVADLGGNHDPLKTTINFATGEVIIDREDGQFQKKDVTTILDQFKEAGAEKDVAFKGNTFADNTVHEFKMFYLERGNQASNLRLSFNLLEPNYGELTKINQDGEALKGIGFDLYEADDNFNPVGDPIAHLTTDENGNARFVKDGTNQSLSFHEGKYLLCETDMIPGYVRSGDVKLVYSEKTHVFHVENTWETGVNGSFKAEFLQAGDLHTIRYDDQGGEIKELIDERTAREGLILMVPMLNTEYKGDQAKEGWRPLYGSKTEGFHMVDLNKRDVNDNMSGVYQRASLEAALRHIANPNDEAWYLEYNEDLDRFESRIEALPGTVDRYVFLNPTDGDLVSTYYMLHVGDSSMKGLSTSEKIEKLRAYLNGGSEKEKELRINDLVEKYSGNMELLDINDFNRLFFPQLFVPNQAREIRVQKQDESGNPLKDAIFALYEDEECTKEVARGITDENGRISFSIENEGNNATNGGELSSSVKVAIARIREQDGTFNDRSYYLKEVEAPEGYSLNTAVTEIRLTSDDMLINAGSKDNGVSVLRGLGKLVRSMVGYASDGKIDATLRDIVATKRTYDEKVKGEQLPSFDTWEVNKGEQPLNLHFGLDTALIEYGLHDKDRKPYFEEKEGWITLDVKQNYEAHMDDDKDTRKTDLRDKDISALFTGTFTIVVTDQRAKGDLNISKIVGGNEGEKKKDFTFEISLMEDGKPHNGTYLYVGGSQDDIHKPEDGELVFKDGKATIALKHGQNITIKDIPSLVTYTVVEEEADQNGYVTSKVGETGVIEEKVLKKAEFTNIKEVKYGGIVVNKIVSGNAGDDSRGFAFRLILDDRSVNGVRDDFFFVNGIANFSLKHGEKKVCNKLPDGVRYRVEEYGADDYTVTSKNESGFIEVDSIKEVYFNNYKTKNDKPTEEKPTEEKPKFPVVNTSVK